MKEYTTVILHHFCMLDEILEYEIAPNNFTPSLTSGIFMAVVHRNSYARGKYTVTQYSE